MAIEVDKAVLLRADRAHVLNALAQFSGTPLVGWLPPGHPAKRGSLPLSWGKAASLPHIQLIEAVAAVSPNHCVDGWGYASRSMSAMLAGDFHASRHLSYYAQLRAALAILGNLGIGIFNGLNFIVDSQGMVVRLDHDPHAPRPPSRGMGTHQVVWDALQEWVAEPGSASRLLSLVRFSGSNLMDCLTAIYPGLAPSGIAGSLIEVWGVDLKRGKQEHVFRNISSYSPHSMNDIQSSVADVLDFVEHTWRILEPTSSSCFDLLDRHILRIVLGEQFRISGVAGGPVRGPISTRYNELPSSVQAIASMDFLTRAIEPDDPTLIDAARRRRHPATAIDMLARALLLLRASTAITLTSFVEAGVSCSSGELRPWLDNLAVMRGFWSPSAPLANPQDLWMDVEIALDDLLASKTPTPLSLNDWMTRTAKGLPTIAEAERIGVWSLGG